MEENRVTSSVVISRCTTINFLQYSHFLDNILNLWAGGGVLQPAPLDQIPHSILHMSSIRVRWSFWPLTSQDSLTCIIIVIVRKDRAACVNLIIQLYKVSLPEHPQNIVEGLPQRQYRRRQICHFLSFAGTFGYGQGVPEPSILGCPIGRSYRAQTCQQS
jgi:hypothetical protein